MHNPVPQRAALQRSTRGRGGKSLKIPGIVGRIWGDPGRPSQVEDIASFAAASSAFDTGEQLDAPGLSAAALRGWSLQDSGICCAISGRVDWLDYELADLQIKQGTACALLQGYRRHGLDLLSRIGGRFALMVWDHGQRRGLIANDRFGQLPVFWAHDNAGDLLFGPTAIAVSRLRGTQVRLSEQGLFNYLHYHMVPGPGTVFEGISKLRAAHVLVGEQGRWHVERYWQPDFREAADGPFSDASEEMLGLLRTSVARLADGADTGAFLSGGLDSSTVSGLLAQHTARPKTYSIGFHAKGYDEIGFAQIASQHFDTEFCTYYVTPEDVLAELPRIAAAYDEPFGNSSALPAYFCARFAASDGRQRLLAGDGGDELFAGNERYAKQTVFERYAQLPAWSRQWLLEPVLFGLPPSMPSIFGKARRYIEQAKVPLPDRLQTYNFINQFGGQQIVTEEFWHSIDAQQPSMLDRELYGEPENASRLNRMLYLDWQHTLTDNDLRKVNRMCELAGIEVEYPMLDDRLVEFSTRVSSQRKMARNRLRDFYKRAVDGFLPRSIIDKPKHGFGLPFGVWMAEHAGLQELALDNLSRMKRRPYIRSEFIDEIIRRHRDQHAGYYGEFIWVLIMLELWLTAQGHQP